MIKKKTTETTRISKERRAEEGQRATRQNN